jgi:hypothetical protein
LWGGMSSHSIVCLAQETNKCNRCYWQQPICPRQFHHLPPRQAREHHLLREVLSHVEVDRVYPPQLDHELRRRPGLPLRC